MKTFLKSQFTSFLATSVDFMITIFLMEITEVNYLLAIATGMILGGITQFIVNRMWTFPSGKGNLPRTIRRFVFLWLLSLGFNMLLNWFMISGMRVNYIVSRIVVSLLSSIFFSYYLQKKYVFIKS